MERRFQLVRQVRHELSPAALGLRLSGFVLYEDDVVARLCIARLAHPVYRHAQDDFRSVRGLKAEMLANELTIVIVVTEKLDGGPRILAGRIAVQKGETADRLRDRVQAVEHQIYPRAAEWFASGRLEYRDGAAWLDHEELLEPVVIDFG